MSTPLPVIFRNQNAKPINSILDDDNITVHQIDSETDELLFDLHYSEYYAIKNWMHE